jgi:Lrp/AsnC family transcriptional regulator for asnA, asnC and gidA
MGHHQLDKLDEKILKMIAKDARIPFLEVARECNVSGAAIHQRIQKLNNLGIIKGSEFIIDASAIGYQTCAFLGIFLKEPEQFRMVVEGLQRIPEVVECYYTTGQYDLFIKIYAKNNKHLLSIIHEKLQPLGLSRTETLMAFNEAFKRQAPIIELEVED